MGVKMAFHVEGERQAGNFREYVAWKKLGPKSVAVILGCGKLHC